ncbi:LOW QUALITY PROTEIN: hypothetical protein HID58_093690, partial [Brassica napus]
SMYDRFIDYDDSHLHFQATLMPEKLLLGVMGVMRKLHTLKANEAGHMLAGECVNPDDTQVPLFILDVEGKTFTFPLDFHHHAHP